MHTQTRRDVRGNQKTTMICFCAKQYRLKYQLMDVGNFDVLAVQEFITQCSWWPPSRSSSDQVNGELNGPWNKLVGGSWKPGPMFRGLATLGGEGLGLRESYWKPVKLCLQEVPASLDPCPYSCCFHSSQFSSVPGSGSLSSQGLSQPGPRLASESCKNHFSTGCPAPVWWECIGR